MSILFRKLPINTIRCSTLKHGDAQIMMISSRNLSIVPSVYDGEQDPAPKFFSTDVQNLLKRLTRPDFAKVFRKRTNSGFPVLKTPKYKFLTDQELELEISKAHSRADRLLQMPPVVKIQKPIEDVISKDPAITGHDEATYMFTDITFGISNEKRLIVQRDPDGTLHSCDHDIRKRLNQTYFPMLGRKIREPKMFTEADLLESLLNREQYEFILDRACIQYEPEEPTYQRVSSITYQHIDANRHYDSLRSTRHFGPFTFYLTWHGSMEGLLLELLQGGAAREAALLLALRHTLRRDLLDGEAATGLVAEIFSTPIQRSRPDHLTEEDIQLDTKCTDVIEKYIVKNSAMKSQHELALQGFRESYQNLVELSRGLRKAHGNA